MKKIGASTKIYGKEYVKAKITKGKEEWLNKRNNKIKTYSSECGKKKELEALDTESG